MKTAKNFEEKKVCQVDSVSKRDEYIQHQRYNEVRRVGYYSVMDLMKTIIAKGYEIDSMIYTM